MTEHVFQIISKIKRTGDLTRRQLDSLVEENAKHCQDHSRGPHDHCIRMRCNTCMHEAFEATYHAGGLTLRCAMCDLVVAVFAIRES